MESDISGAGAPGRLPGPQGRGLGAAGGMTAVGGACPLDHPMLSVKLEVTHEHTTRCYLSVYTHGFYDKEVNKQ